MKMAADWPLYFPPDLKGIRRGTETFRICNGGWSFLMAGSALSFPCEYLLAMSMVKQEINGTGRLLVPPLQKYV